MNNKIICLVCLIFVFLLMCGCSTTITEGEVYAKEYREAFTTVNCYPVVISNGKTTTTMIIPYTVYYPERWVIFIKSFEDGEWLTDDYFVSENIYNSINVGDIFVYDGSRGDLKDEPYTKEKAETSSDETTQNCPIN